MNSIYFNKIRAIVNEFDPCNLIHFGAPLDEYDDLTNLIISHYQDKKSKVELKTIIIDRIENYFGCLELVSMNLENKTRFMRDLEIILNEIDMELT
jgi:hypothetical protein